MGSEQSQGQTALAGTFGHRRNTAVVLVAAAIEHDGVDAGSFGALSDELADLAGLHCLVTGQRAQVCLELRCLDERAANGVVDHLRHDVPGRARHHEARTLRRTGDLLAKPHMTTGPGDCLAASLDYQSHRLLTSLSDLAADLLAGVPNTLALVRLGLADLADVRSDLANLLLVDATDRELGRALHGERDACRGGHRDRVREAEGELEVLALGRHAVTCSDDLELLLVAIRDAGDEVRQQGPGEAVQ